LFLIAVAPFPLMQKLALFCGFWALTLFPANVLVSPVILSYLPAPANVGRIVSRAERAPLHAWIAALLSRIAPLCHGPGSWKTGAALVIAVAVGGISVTRLAVGNEQEGTSLLWPNSDYNRAARELNSHFPGMNTLEIVFEGSSASAMRRSEAVFAMRELQRQIESEPNPPPATLSFADYLPEINRLFNGGNPKWLPLDRDERKLQGVVNGLLFGSNTKNLSQVVDLELRNGTVTVWLKDLKAETIDRALAQARRAMAAIGENQRGFRILLGSGVAALQKAVNERIATYEWTIGALVLLVMFITCSLAYRSVIASLILLIPVGTANLLLAACMLALGISLDVNTLPVMAIGIGIGIDYGIYLLSRLREEARGQPDTGVVIQNSVTTTGKAVFFTATIVLIGLLPWYALSNLKFQADMGLLLAVVMIINMGSALVVVPFLVSLTRRRFAFGNAWKAEEREW
jgi:predicted RND superfamily exporter protein